MKGMSIAGLVCGIVSLVIGWFGVLSFVALPLAIVGLVLAVLAGKKYKAAGQKSGLAKAALIVGIVAVSICAITFISCGLCVACAAASV